MLYPVPFRLHSVSVVITAQVHNPSILTAGFLKSEGIVPEQWVVGQTINVPPLSLVQFQNGIQWTLDESRLIVTENCESSFEDSYRIHECVSKYLRKVEYVPYRSLGLNCIVSMKSPDPDIWLRTQFLRHGPWLSDEHRLTTMIPKFGFDGYNSVLNLAFGNQIILQGNVEKAVSVDCNVHHEGPLNAAQLREAIGQWKSHQDDILNKLIMLAGDQLR